MKLRNPKTGSLVLGVMYDAIASVGVGVLWYINGLTPIAAIAFGIVLPKFTLILVRQDWYRTTRIQNVAKLETVSAPILFSDRRDRSSTCPP
ncbi:hypothetical protein [Chroococcidiopsis sp. TS-821]|uniref:hypothetical protein n=1 Tax=Chroococcidiopsis sp. TS-821 TaxID=1378066 RepID=UPI001AEF60A6|nr:hypothetical protein [Chroococcidiopsis sp. TS-821]